VTRKCSVRVVASVGHGSDHDGMKTLMHAFVRFQKNPASVRYAAAAIMSTIVILVLVGAAFMRVFDADTYPTFGGAVWFTLQTVTTVGYGDNTPTSTIGRVVASVVMLVSIALITVVTAGITSMLIGALSREQGAADQRTYTETLARIEASLTEAHERLDRLAGLISPHHNDSEEPHNDS
jgi:voltage-gated potassium channel